MMTRRRSLLRRTYGLTLGLVAVSVVVPSYHRWMARYTPDRTFFVTQPQQVRPPSRPLPPPPQIVWLLSFPNSGTSYTMINVLKTSHRAVGTNYAREIEYNRSHPIPIHLNGTSPFYLRTQYELPRHYVLTKSHCAGYCDSCPPMEDLAAFEQKCANLGVYDANGKYVKANYSSTMVKKAVHLIRDPFDNIVAKKHLGIRNLKKVKNWTDEQIEPFRHDTIQAVLAWCNYLDGKFRGDLDGIMKRHHVPQKLYETLPCRVDFMRYVMWHNNAIETMEERLKIPVHTMFYEDYTLDYNKTVADLLRFLRLEPKQPNLEFLAGKSYRSLFDSKMRVKIGKFVKALASDKCWGLLKRYF